MIFTFFVLEHTNLIYRTDHPTIYTAFAELNETLRVILVEIDTTILRQF